MAATLAVSAGPISPEGRRLLRHASLHARHARLEQVIRGLRAQAERTGDTVSGRELTETLSGFEHALDAVRRELRQLGQAPRRSPRG